MGAQLLRESRPQLIPFCLIHRRYRLLEVMQSLKNLQARLDIKVTKAYQYRQKDKFPTLSGIQQGNGFNIIDIT